MSYLNKNVRTLRSIAAILAATTAAIGLSSTAAANDGLYSVQLNKTEILRLPSAAGAVIVGNPEIADVTIHASDTIFVIGKGYGETNLVILDKEGNTMMSSDIQVITPQSRNQVRIFNSSQGRQTYNCGPNCNPSPTLGDSADFVEGNTGSSGGGFLENLFAAASGGNSSASASGSSSNAANDPN